MTPRLAWVLGDAAGIGPELVAKSLASEAMLAICRPVVVGPMWLFERGLQAAKVGISATRCDPAQIDAVASGVFPVVDTGWPLQEIPFGKLSAEAGKLCIQMLRLAVDLARAKQVEGIVFGPLNKEALSRGATRTRTSCTCWRSGWAIPRWARSMPLPVSSRPASRRTSPSRTSRQAFARTGSCWRSGCSTGPCERSELRMEGSAWQP